MGYEPMSPEDEVYADVPDCPVCGIPMDWCEKREVFFCHIDEDVIIDTELYIYDNDVN